MYRKHHQCQSWPRILMASLVWFLGHPSMQPLCQYQRGVHNTSRLAVTPVLIFFNPVMDLFQFRHGTCGHPTTREINNLFVSLLTTDVLFFCQQKTLHYMVSTTICKNCLFCFPTVICSLENFRLQADGG